MNQVILKNMEIEKFLETAGLEDSEAKVYLALLELGPSTVSQVTKKAHITRTLGYHVLEKLGWYGLVDRVSGKDSKQRYSANHPRSFLQYVKNQKNKWDKSLDKANKYFPNLVDLYKIQEKPNIRFREGVKGVKELYEESLKSKTEILSITDIEGWKHKDFNTWGKGFNKERSKRRIIERMLLLDTKAGREWMKDYRGSFKYTHYKWIKPEQLPGVLDFQGEINIYENKTVLVTLKKSNRMIISVESTQMVNIFKALFELAWNAGKPFSKEIKKKK